MDPNDAILSRLGRGDIGPGGVIGDKRTLTILDDRNMPLGGGSCGPNGVLTDCHVAFGANRINLFHQDIASTGELLGAYIALRDEHLGAAFDMYLRKLQARPSLPPRWSNPSRLLSTKSCSSQAPHALCFKTAPDACKT